MASASARPLLRPGLLDGLRVVLSGGRAPNSELRDRLGELGASVAAVELEIGDDVESDESRATEDLASAHRQLEGLDAIVIDGDALFVAAPNGRALQLAPVAIWNGTRAFANLLIASGGRGRILITAPLSSRGAHVAAAVAAVENLARTLSIEWARYGITSVAIAPGSQTQTELAELCAYLISPAGSYFSGCLLDLRGVD